MKQSADLVIIGAGIVGSSCVYHLAQRGWRNIVVVDQGPLYTTGGSTSHAPGLVFQTNASKTMCQIAQNTVQLYSSLELDGEPCFYAVGGIEVAYTEKRWRDLHRKLGLAKSWGLQGAALLSPAEVKRSIPLIDPDVIFGGYHVSMDGIGKGVRACTALCRAAEQAGAATFYGQTTVTGFDIRQGRVHAVQTDQGEITTPRVLLCAGIWGPTVAALAGVSVPLTPVQHQYVLTTPLPELAGDHDQEVVHPILRHQDFSMYFRQQGDRYGIGNYRHEPLLIESEAILSPAQAPVMPSVLEFTPEHFGVARTATAELMPVLASAELTYKINGMFSFTPDGNPVVGESEVDGFWIAEAVWVTHGGGVGEIVAELMDTGGASLDLRELDLHRFHSHVHTKPYIRARGAQQYREVYDIIHPKQQMEHPRPLRVTPVHSRIEALGGVFFESVGWERAQWHTANAALLEEYNIPPRDEWTARYWSPIEGAEHHATRNNVAIYDITPFTKIRIEGPGACTFLNYVATNQIDVPVGKVVYTSLLNHSGGIMCDLTITRLAPDVFLVLTGGGVGMHDLAWLRRNAPRDGSVTITDVTSAYATFGLWGPNARRLLQTLTENDLSNDAFPYFSAQPICVEHIPLLALRLSYVGELGWELYVPSEYGLRLWDTIWSIGDNFGLVAGGGGAFDALRLEKGYRLWGNDIHSEYNPLEAGLGWAVRFNKGDFIGRDALEQIKQEGIDRRLCCLTLDDPTAVLLGKEPVLHNNGGQARVVGYVTSTNYGYTIGRSVAYAYLPLDLASVGVKLSIEYFGRQLAATVQEEPLYDPTMTRLKR